MTDSDDLSALREKPFADAVVKLEELLAQSGRAFLIGAGCSTCAGLPLTAELSEKALTSTALDETTKKILAALRDLFNGADSANIEDYLSELVDLLAIANRRAARGATQNEVTLGGNSYGEALLRTAADQIKRGIAEIIEQKVSIDTHLSFIRALHRPIRPGTPTAGQRVDYLVLNYDTVLEDALALERVPFADGLEGGATGWWSPQTFDRDGLSARVFKLHGSINWCEFLDDPLPRRVGTYLQIAAVNERRILIWPASTKYREAQLDPYAQLAERARRVLRPSPGSQCVLVVCGYTINRQRFEHNAHELEAALVLVRKAANAEALSTDQERGLIDVIARYTQTLLLLQRNDEGLKVEPKGIAGIGGDCAKSSDTTMRTACEA
jgi:SIR2-like domain